MTHSSTTPAESRRPLAWANRHPVIVGVSAVAIIAFAIYVAAFRSNEIRPKAYFTTDGGRSFFAADAWEPAPKTINGQEADYAFVYSTDGGKTLFVGYVMRYTPEGRAKAIKMRDAGNWGPIDEIEVKRPGDHPWVAKPSHEQVARQQARGEENDYESIVDVRSPEGQPPARLMQPRP